MSFWSLSASDSCPSKQLPESRPGGGGSNAHIRASAWAQKSPSFLLNGPGQRKFTLFVYHQNGPTPKSTKLSSLFLCTARMVQPQKVQNSGQGVRMGQGKAGGFILCANLVDGSPSGRRRTKHLSAVLADEASSRVQARVGLQNYPSPLNVNKYTNGVMFSYLLSGNHSCPFGKNDRNPW